VNEIEAELSPSPAPPVLDEKEALRQSIERSEAELREAVEELTTAVKNEVTLGVHVVQHPTLWLAGGFAVGLMVALRR